MIRIFVYEYVCGGGLAGRALPASLAREGWAMLASIVEDLARIERLHVVTMLDERLLGRPLAARAVQPVPAGAEREAVERLARSADWSLVIAPECAGILAERAAWVRSAGGRLLGPADSTLQLASDKLACCRLLERHAVPTAPSRLVRLAGGLPADLSFPAVLKPRDGAGSQATFLIRDAESAPAIARAALAEGLTGDAVVQPLVRGLAASVAFLTGPAGAVPLLPAEQLLSGDGRFRYVGGRVPLEPALAGRAVELGLRAVRALPDCHGYIGVDLVLDAGEGGAGASDASAAAETERRDAVIEINPRLTTSYVGLRRLAEPNLAELLVRACRGEPIGPIRWRSGRVCFRADGTLA